MERVAKCVQIWVSLSLVAGFVQSLTAQSVSLPSLRLASDYLNWQPVTSSSTQIFYEQRYLGANNVIALKEGTRKTLSPYQVTASNPFAVSEKLSRWRVRYRRWEIEFAEGSLSLLRGNSDAAQLWLDTKAKVVNPQRFYFPFATEQKGRWRWLGLSHFVPFRSHQVKGELTLTLRYLVCHRFRDGWLSGTYNNDRLMGELEFVSSQGIGFRAPEGKGFALDLAVNARKGKWSASFAVEGIWGQVRWKRLRKVSALVDTNALAQDPEGFIRSLPFLVGREEFSSFTRPVGKQWLIGFGYKQSRWQWNLALSEQAGRHSLHLGAIWSLASRSGIFVDFQTPFRSVSLGYSSPNLNLLLTLSHPDPSKAMALGIQVQFFAR
mgnify:CR=1 FL=1